MKNRFLQLVTFLAFSSSLLLAASITGTVTNKTTNKPAAGETVTLLNLSSGMEEVGSTKTDSKGHYKLDASGSGTMMIRVDHQKSPYYKNVAQGTTTADVVIYDVAAKVDGISTDANILRIEAQSGKLTVAEIYYVSNNSQPARTQQSDRTYEVYIPAEAVLDSTEAMGPSGMSIPITPSSLAEKGHYALNFPIRPNGGDKGENGTTYQIVWHVNYSGSYKISPRLLLGAGEVAVMLPKSMSLKPGTSSSLHATSDVDGAQTWLAKGASPTQSLEFTVSGTGTLPQDAQQGGGAMGGNGEAAGANAATTNGPGGGLGAPIDTPDALQKYKYWILGGLAVILAIIAGFMLRKPANAGPQAMVAAPTEEPGTLPKVHSIETPLHPDPAYSHNLITSLKEELFTLETERIQGKVTDEEYASHKAALEVLMRRALR